MSTLNMCHQKRNETTPNKTLQNLRVRNCNPRFAVFPQDTDEEKRLFELLRKAYVEARNKMEENSITKAELDYLRFTSADLHSKNPVESPMDRCAHAQPEMIKKCSLFLNKDGILTLKDGNRKGRFIETGLPEKGDG